jgi:uncharacterized LabA/DUF88 family protein
MVPESRRRLWLIDGAYLFNARQSVSPNYLYDYLKLRQRLEESGALWRAYYLNSTPDPSHDEQDSFHTWLRSGPPRGPKIITRLYPLRDVPADRAYCEQCASKVRLACPVGADHRILNKQQKGVDVGIATLALVHKDRYDGLILSSGDGDLVDMVEFLSESGKHIELLVFSEGVSTDLQARADVVHWINDFSDVVKRVPPSQE